MEEEEDDDFGFGLDDDEIDDLINLGGELGEVNVIDGLTLTIGGTDWIHNNGNFIQSGSQNISLRPHPDKEPIYSLEDIDKVVMMLTLWIDDEAIINKIEKMFKYWRDLQK